MVQLLRSDRAELGARGNLKRPAFVRHALVRTGEFFFKYRDAVAPPVFLALVLLTQPRLAFDSARGDLLLDALGILLVLAAQVLRALVIGYAYIVRGGKNKQVYADTLVRSGLFAHARNPLYLGNLLGIFGLLIIHNATWAYAIGIPFSLFLYLTIIMAEEDFLGKKFGTEYERYRRQVPRFIPNLRGIGKTLRVNRFNWRRLVVKEYGTTFNGGVMILLLLALETYRNFGFAASVTRFKVLGCMLAALTIGFSVARYLKKTGKLNTT